MATTDIKIGACEVTFAGTVLGHTQGGETFSYEPNYADIMVDQYGETPVDKVLNGENVTITVRLAETSLDNLLVAMPTGTEASATKLTFGKDAGFRLSSVAGTLKLHPLSAGADKSSDIYVYKAVVTDAVEVEYNNEDVRIVEVTFTALVDTSKSSGNYLFYMGDSV